MDSQGGKTEALPEVKLWLNTVPISYDPDCNRSFLEKGRLTSEGGFTIHEIAYTNELTPARVIQDLHVILMKMGYEKTAIKDVIVEHIKAKKGCWTVDDIVSKLDILNSK